MTAALNNYGESAAAASADLFDDIMAAEGLSVHAVMRNGIVTVDEVKRIAHYQATKLLSDDVDGFIYEMANSTAYMTRQVANGTMMSQSVLTQYRGGWEYRDNLRGGKGRAVWSYSSNGVSTEYQIRYARIPQGAETCDFCLMLASRGFVYLSEASAEGWNHVHRNCDCIVIAGVVHKDGSEWVQDTQVEGYDHKQLQQIWGKWSGISRYDTEARLDALEEVTGSREW